MMRTRTVILIGSLGLAGGWIAGTSSGPVERDLPAERRSGPRPLGVQANSQAPFTERLRQRLDDRPRSPLPGRNPFVFGARDAHPARHAAPSVEAVEPVLETPVPLAPPPPRFKLSGVASTEKDGAVHFTAILTDNDALVFAESGASLSGGHRVLRIDERAVVIVDAVGSEITLRLP